MRRFGSKCVGMSETLLDVKGMNCPLPVLRANRALRGLGAGGRGCGCWRPIARRWATSRRSAAKPAMHCLSLGEEAGVFSFVIRKREAAGTTP